MKISVVQQLILDALIRLLDVYTFDKITITQLTQEAKVARKTFYLNFDSKEQVIEMYINELQSRFENTLQLEHVSDLRELSQVFFVFFGQHS
jgi:AcrR family transcriptional regulator